MPYYRTTDHEYVPSSMNGTNYVLQTRLFYEKIGFRSKPKSGLNSVVEIPSGEAEPYSWLDSYNAVKATTFQSQHPELASLFKKDKGHAWDLATCDFIGDPVSFVTTSGGWPFITANNVRPIASAAPLNRLLLGDEYYGHSVSNYAALEYGRTAPTSDEISMTAIIGELREGLPKLIPAFLTTGTKRDFKATVERQSRRARDAGGDYLNVQFGWIPLLSDVRKIATALAVATAAISGPGTSTHRRRDKTEVDETFSGTSSNVNWLLTEESATHNTGLPGVSISGGWLNHSVWFTQRHTIDLSFEAEFIRLPEGQKDYSSYLTRLDELMRWDITPMDLWQLSPWSWLVDWFFDIGGQLESWNSATTNRILSLYAYGMRDESITTTLNLSGISGKPGVDYVGPSSVFSQTIARRRQRVKANPFGYTLNPLNSLSGGQLAILGALGLTKIR